jgi:hypothetical protein
MKKLLFGLFILLSLFSSTALLGSDTIYAAGCNSSTTVDISCLPDVQANHSTVAIALNITFTIVGAISVIMIIISGLKFITSSGKPEEIAKAKDTIIYAAVGIVVSILAVTIVSFVAGII